MLIHQPLILHVKRLAARNIFLSYDRLRDIGCNKNAIPVMYTFCHA